MTALIFLALLQAPDDLAAFLAALEKDRAAGVAREDLVKRIDKFCEGRPEPIKSRLAWNRALLEATRKMDGLRVEWLTRYLGKEAALGRTTGTVRAVKPDRVVFETPTGTLEIPFRTLAPDEGVAELKTEELLADGRAEEAIVVFASGKSAAAMTLARALEPPLEKERALAAFVGWALQSADRGLAEGKLEQVTEDLAAWTPHIDLMEAGMGALHSFVENSFVPRLFEESGALAAKDRKRARKLLDLVPLLTKSKRHLEKLAGFVWATLERNQWLAIPLDHLPESEGVKWDGSKLILHDLSNGEFTSTLEVNQLPVPWEEIAGFRTRVRPGSIDYVDLRIGFGTPARYHIAALETKKKKTVVFYDYVESRGQNGKPGDFKKYAKRTEYEFRLEGVKDTWRLFVDSVVLNTVRVEGSPTQILIVFHDGKGELASLEVRKK